MEIMQNMFVKMLGTLSILIVIATFIGGSNVITKLSEGTRSRRAVFLIGLVGGLFGIYGNLSGLEINGAIVSMRDLGPMVAGFLGGPVGGLLAGLIAGIHRVALGGLTAKACMIATCLIGLICGALSQKYRERIIKPQWSFLVGILMECMHLSIVLLIVKPFDTAMDIVSRIAVPFILSNAIGFTVLIFLITYIEKQVKEREDRNRLKGELESAAVIQKSLIEPPTERFPGRKEISITASMDAAKEVGGDFYDIFFTDDDTLVIVVADVSGKGIPAAMYMVRSKLTIRNYMRRIPDLAKAVSTANNVLCENNDMEMFVTAWIGAIDLKTGRIRYVNAGHNPPVLITENGVDFLKGKHGIVLAGMEDFPFNEQEVQLEPGNAMFLYTDGVTEAENEYHELFGDDRLLVSLEGAAGKDVNAIKEGVKKGLDDHVAGFDQFDDITMMCFRYNGQEGKGNTEEASE